MTSGSAARRIKETRERQLAEDAAQLARRFRISVAIKSLIAVAVVAVVAVGLWSAQSSETTATGTAPNFTLMSSEGKEVSLSAYKGHPVLLYFNEGAGCDACIVQMEKIEKDPAFAKDGITVLPIVMNTADQINADRNRLGVTTPFLLDNGGTVSKQYGTFGIGMHKNLPGHSFVLVNAEGKQVWKGVYPSMWIDPKALMGIVSSHLKG